MSLRIVPEKAYPTSTASLASQGQSFSAPSAPGVHDTLRANQFSSQKQPPNPSAAASGPASHPHTALPAPESAHPLEARLARWRATQHALKMEGLKRTFGAAEPIRRGMELGIVRGGEWRAGALGGSEGVAGDVLEGRDWSLEWEDVFKGDETREMPDFHTEMESRLHMNR